MNLRLIALGLLLLIPNFARAVCYGDQAKAAEPIIFTPVPQFPASTLFARWSPLLENVGNTTGQCFELVIKTSIPEFEHYLLTGTPSMAYVNPYHAVMAYKAKAYQPLLADGSMLLTGILVAKKDGDIRQLSDLQGKRVDFPAPNAFAASLLIRSHLEQQKISVRTSYVKTHSNVYRGVILDEAAAGGGVNKTLEAEPQEIRQKLRVIYETPGYRSHPIITSSKISRSLRDKLLHAFINLEKSDQGRALLLGVQLNEPIAVTYQKDYKPLENLNLDKLVVPDERP